jgi:hypothetical protein
MDKIAPTLPFVNTFDKIFSPFFGPRNPAEPASGSLFSALLPFSGPQNAEGIRKRQSKRQGNLQGSEITGVSISFQGKEKPCER